MSVNPYEKYKQQSLMTMTQGEMLIKLYDETLKQMTSAVLSLEKGDLPLANKALQKAQRIINHLRTTLNFKYDISRNLESLYDFFISKIVEANIKKIAPPIEEILPLVTELRDSFVQAERSARMQVSE